MSSLFMVMLGGRHMRANTEVHDVVFVVADQLSESYTQLQQAWFAEPQGLHIDAWMQLNGVNCEGRAYRIEIRDQAVRMPAAKLWLINLGGYDAQQFGELHRYILVVADHAVAAKQIGKKHAEQHWQKTHTDRVLEVDDCIAIDCLAGKYVHLIEDEFLENPWENCYITIA